MSATTEAPLQNGLLTIGAVCRRLQGEFPDIGSMSNQELKDLIGELTDEEREISYRRRLLHGKIDILRAELVARLQRSGGRSVLDQLDVSRLTDILTGKHSPE